MKNLTALVTFLLLSPALGLAAGPVYARESAAAVVLGNDYLERTISIADGDAGTRQFLNKLTGRAYALGGSEFELRLTWERVGYEPGDENPLVVTAAGMRVAAHKVEDVAGGGKRVVLDLAPAGRGETAIGATVVYELKPDDFFTRQWIVLPKPRRGTYFVDWVSVAKNRWGLPHFSLGGFGQPLFTDDLFLGEEYPTSINKASGPEADLGGYVGIDVPEGGYTSEPAVMGVAPAGLVHQQFLKYVDRMRVTPVHPFLLYNSWYDLQRLSMNHDNTLERVKVIDSLLLKKYGLHMDSFVLDDGWDDMHKLWAIDEQRFPGGFQDLVAALKGIGTNLGLWFGPIGGYNQRQVRIATGKAAGMEVTSNGQYFCLAGRNYSKYLSDTMARYQKEYGVSYFKLDGMPMGCNEPDHGHPMGIYSREADVRVLIDMLKRLRAQDPKVFLNITTSMWLSPWWLRYTDTVWMGGADSGYLPSVPTLAQRQSAVSYRDSVLYSDFVAHKEQFPLSSLMTHGIIKGRFNMLGGKKEYIDDWRDEVVHYYSVGNMMYELYISPDILSPEEADSLGSTTRWAEANAHPLLDNCTMVLGDPAEREPYGYVHSSAERSIVTLRNPFVRPRTVHLKLDEQNGFQPTAQPLAVEFEYPYREMQPGTVRFGDTLTFDLSSYEEIVLELRPAAENDLRIEGVRYSAAKAADGSVTLRLYAPAGATQAVRVSGAPAGLPVRPDGTVEVKFGGAPAGELAFSPATVETEGAAGADRTVHVRAAIEVPADYREARLAFLIEPGKEARNVKAEATDGGKPAEVTLENAGRGTWHWVWTDLAPGKHNVEFVIHLPAAAGVARVSGWLLTKRALASQELHLKAGNLRVPEGNLLPATSELERNTYALMEETIR